MMLADFLGLGQQALDALTYIVRWLGEKSLELLVFGWDKAFEGHSQTLGIMPEGGVRPEFGDPVASADWRPWQHLVLPGNPLDSVGMIDAWLPLRECVGAILLLAALTMSRFVISFIRKALPF